jgi:2,4-dienoyl-CoA reductase-like NADH-dependent reductase (Old Yellow Enzyme family)
MTPWHHVHLGSFAARGAGLVLTEVISVSPEGRISPQDLGLWEDGQIEPLKQIVDFAHSQGTSFGIQLGHAGRKASTVAPWIDRKAAARNFVCHIITHKASPATLSKTRIAADAVI